MAVIGRSTRVILPVAMIGRLVGLAATLPDRPGSRTDGTPGFGATTPVATAVAATSVPVGRDDGGGDAGRDADAGPDRAAGRD